MSEGREGNTTFVPSEKSVNVRPRDFAGLILLGALWGGSFLFIRVAVPALGPFLLVELRVGLAVAALFLYALAVGSMPKIRGRWRSFLVLGS